MSGHGDRGPSLRRFYGNLARRVPWWASALLGLAAAGLGVAITAKPFSSLDVLIALVAIALVVTGVSELASADTGLGRAAGAAWIAAGVAVAVWPGLTVRALAVIVGVSLAVGGLLRIASGLRRDADERFVSIVSGLARAVFGALALSWPDVTVLVVALLVGPAMILFGIGQVASALRRRDDPGGARGGRRWPAWLRVAGVSGSLAVALGLLGVSAAVHEASPSVDAFYEAPDGVPAEPGALVRGEPFERGIPDGARAWRILYTSSRDDETPALASAIVVAPEAAPPGPRPVIAWAHGTTGYAPRCAPSLLEEPFTAGAMPALDEVLARGWILVATDYVGLGTEGPHPYLIGEPVARSVLDSVRAARALEGVEIGDRTVVWGHSQGGGAALWTGVIAPRYAPDAGVIGVAALAPATRLPQIFEAVRDEPVGKIMGSYALSAYEAVYPDVRFDDYVRPEARLLARETAGRCLSGPEALFSVGTALGTEPWFSRSPASGPLGARLSQNVPEGPIDAPLLVAQGAADVLVLPAEQRRWAAGRCAAGQAMEYRAYEGLDHVGLVLAPDSALIPDLLRWTDDRLGGRPAPSGCTAPRG